MPPRDLQRIREIALGDYLQPDCPQKQQAAIKTHQGNGQAKVEDVMETQTKNMENEMETGITWGL